MRSNRFFVSRTGSAHGVDGTGAVTQLKVVH